MTLMIILIACLLVGFALAWLMGRLFGGIRTGEQTGKETVFWDGLEH